MDDDGNEPMDQLTAHLDRGWDLVSRGDLAGAMVSAEKSLELDEESPEAHNLLGYIFQAQGRPEEALEHYRAALDLEESYVDAMLNAADVLLHPLNDHDAALAYVDEALDWLVEDELDLVADALLIKVDVFLARDDREAAKRVVKLLPDGPFENPQLYLQVGRARFEVGDVEGADPLIRKACNEQPPMADAFYYLGLILEAKGDRRGALVALLSARDLDRASPPPPWSLPQDQFERRVQSALMKLRPPFASAMEGALVVVTEIPGAEVVAEGVDPRIGVRLDDLPPEPGSAPPRVGRLFVYQRNVERVAAGLLDVEDEIVHAIESELSAAFPQLAAAAPSGDGAS
jgi:tetratricopeptide (TPR) repeat protein